MVELMRLPSRPREELARGIEGDGIERLASQWRESGQAMIIVAGHVGNNEAVAAAVAGAGYPANVIADDSAFPELFELLRRQREGWGVKVIPWRNLRELFGVLKRREILALLVDWGYRDDGIPVAPVRRVDDAPGRPRDPRREDRRDHRPRGDPPAAVRAVPDRGVRAVHGPVLVAGGPPARHPAHRRQPPGDDRRRAGAVVQLQAHLAVRPGRGPPPRGGRRPNARRRTPLMADPGDGRPSLRGRLLITAAGLLAVLPERPLVAAADSVGELWYRLAPARAAQARANLRRVCEDLRGDGTGPSPRPARRHRAAGAGAPRPGLLPAHRPLLPRGRTGGQLRHRDRPREDGRRDPGRGPRGAPVRRTGDPARPPLRRDRAADRVHGPPPRPARRRRRWRPSATRRSRAGSARAAAAWGRTWSRSSTRDAPCSTRCGGAIPWASSTTAT